VKAVFFCFIAQIVWAQALWAQAPGLPRTLGKSLTEAYLAALKRSEAVGMQREIWLQADEIEHQAKAALLPNLTATGNFLRQETPTGATGISISPASQSTVKITGDQPLFRGFREYAALRQKNAAVDAQAATTLTAARQLFYDVSNAYYNLLIAHSDCVNFENEIKVNENRLKELQGFLRIGRSRMTELLTFQTNISSLEAQLETSRTMYETAKDVLAFLTGWNRETPITDTEAGSLALESDVAHYLKRIDERPEVRAAIANVKVTDEGISIARGAHFPSIDLLGDYYLDRPGALSSVNWDVQLAVSMPIFSGGAIQSQVRQAVSIARQYELQLSLSRRAAEEEIRTFYDLAVGDRRILTKLSNTVDLSKKNYEAQLKDYRNGLVTNLDVLQSITAYQDSQRLLDRHFYTVRLDTVKLQAAAAERDEIHVEK
jgi:outer membrane protein